MARKSAKTKATTPSVRGSSKSSVANQGSQRDLVDTLPYDAADIATRVRLAVDGSGTTNNPKLAPLGVLAAGPDGIFMALAFCFDLQRKLCLMFDMLDPSLTAESRATLIQRHVDVITEICDPELNWRQRAEIAEQRFIQQYNCIFPRYRDLVQSFVDVNLNELWRNPESRIPEGIDCSGATITP
jgi:hypothetical protein